MMTVKTVQEKLNAYTDIQYALASFLSYIYPALETVDGGLPFGFEFSVYVKTEICKVIFQIRVRAFRRGFQT